MTLSQSTGLIVRLGIKPQVAGERGIPKQSVPEAAVARLGLKGDYNRYRTERKVNDPDMAILIMTAEKIAQINQSGWPVRPGDLGENLLIEGVPYSSFAPGVVVEAGEVTLEITRACAPCINLQVLPYVGPGKADAFVKSLLHRRGWYARVKTPGTLRRGEEVRVGGEGL